MLCRELDVRGIIGGDDLCKVLCYPSGDRRCCYNRLEELDKLGIANVYNFGDVQIGKNVWIVGKGHAAIVVLAQHRFYGLVALKIRRVDSKRDSLEGEAKIIEIAYRTGYAPRLMAYSRDIIVRQYIDGQSLGKVLKEGYIENIRTAVTSLVKAALELDKNNIDIIELANPVNQVIYICNNMEKPIFIDLETARLYPNPSNITRILSFILRSRIENKSLISLLNIENKVNDLTELGKQYKKASNTREKENIVNKLLQLLC
ncbi:MAG: hypothetical protein QXT53_07890 [Ignisphaera sp.]